MFNLESNWPKFTILFFLFLISTAFFIPDWSKEKINTYDRFDLNNISLCAPIDRPKVEFGDMMTPLAPKLNYNWDHNFAITTSSTEA